MLYVKIENGRAVQVSSEYPKEVNGQFDRSFQSRHDWQSFEQAEAIASSVTELTGDVYLPTDAGPHVSPRFDIVRAPKVGDEVSYSFNGDTYPDGTIVKVNANHRFVWTDGGKKYIRNKQTGGWKNGGTWYLVQGHRFEQNPHF